ncbi:very short patch repair endonuclease [Stenotrophomonas sp.]|uniref:very short patch repair endonuclease n=1 Tax=Stenotrophomonas sp. TaxID=69392 RepID=UPI00289DA03C|nr:very short patch repair endonuclease [Stenotrophomonas sp.]
MVDVMSSAVRSALMSRIKAKNTKPELIVRRSLWARGFRFGLHSKRLAGRPDLVLPKWKAVVFVHGCFWHAHAGCPFFRLPKTRPEFWAEKLDANRRRDLAAINSLMQNGWRVGVVWECALRLDETSVIDGLQIWLTGSTKNVEIRAKAGVIAIDELSSLEI